MNILRWANILPGGIVKLRFCSIGIIAGMPFPAFIKKGALLGNGIYSTKWLSPYGTAYSKQYYPNSVFQHGILATASSRKVIDQTIMKTLRNIQTKSLFAGKQEDR